MKKIYALFLAFVFTISAYSQNSYKKGSFLSVANQKVECYIFDLDWNNSPTSFKYKLTEDGEVKDMYVTSITEFQIDGVSKWVKKTVQFDDSLTGIRNITDVRTPTFKEEHLLLKVLIEGQATLYKYIGRDSAKFFFSIENGETEQLIFKEYLQSQAIAQNNDYKQKLFNSLKCENFKSSRFEKLDYKEDDLKKLFVDYNTCMDANFENKFEKNQNKRDIFNFNLRPGFSYTSLSISNFQREYKNVVFDNEIEFRLGAEFEMILPINNNKWAIIIEPTFHKYQTTELLNIPEQELNVNYTSIELILGMRYYFFLNDKSKIFTNLSFTPVDFVSNNSSFDYESSTDLSIFTTTNFGFGVGYSYNNKYSVELRAMSSKNILSDYYYWDSKYTPFSVIFGYTLF